MLAAVGLAGSWFGPAGAQSARAPLVNKAGTGAIPDHYIVVFKRGTAVSAMSAAHNVARGAGGKIGFTYQRALRGFSVEASPAAIDRLRALPDVAYVEVDAVVKATTIQNNPPLGLDRTSERFLPLNNKFTYSENGTGVHAYVLDTGIRTTHDEFGGRATGDFTAISDGNGTDDCAGHGTHVAGTIGAEHYGIAKNVNLHAVRVLDCDGNGTISGAISGIDWVADNAILPAVANMSLRGIGVFNSLNDAVTDAIAAGIVFVVAAGNDTLDACGISPALTPDAITVGSVDPTNDTQSWFSNFGSCLDLYGPGENIESTWNTSDNATAFSDGTSMASPHVAGVAALYLQNHPAESPAGVRQAIMDAADTSLTMGWPGISSLSVGSPNILLHWGSVNDGKTDGDPHLKTVEGIKYDFQGAGEYVLLRDANGMQIQTRQAPVQTSWHIGPDDYTGLGGCVSINTAVAALVNGHRVTFQPSQTTANRMQLRVDGALTNLGPDGLLLGANGRVIGSLSDGIEVNLPDGTTLIATPKFWNAQNRWYLSVKVYHSTGTEGLLGTRAPGSWLPQLPGGGSVGPKPAALHQRYLSLYNVFGNAWRVSNATSLFDYAPGTSTATFTLPSWPPENPPCTIAGVGQPPVDPVDPPVAERMCRAVVDAEQHADCVADVTVTGEAGFAQLHQVSDTLQRGSTRTWLDDADPTTAPGAAVRFTATVTKNAAAPAATPIGTVQLVVDGANAGPPIALDAKGRAVWTLQTLAPGVHQVSARYTPSLGSAFLASSSLPRIHQVR